MDKLYVLVYSGSNIISTPSFLPSVYKNISNFSNLGVTQPELLKDLAWSGNPNEGFYETYVETRPTCSISYDITSDYTIDTSNYTVTQSFSTIASSQQIIDARNEDLWNQIRRIRTRYLKDTDWTMLPDVDMPTEKVQEYVVFRQKLRSITDDYNDPSQVVWPTIPTSSSLDPFPDVPTYSC